jgi:hypothetical protein
MRRSSALSFHAWGVPPSHASLDRELVLGTPMLVTSNSHCPHAFHAGLYAAERAAGVTTRSPSPVSKYGRRLWVSGDLVTASCAPRRQLAQALEDSACGGRAPGGALRKLEVPVARGPGRVAERSEQRSVLGWASLAGNGARQAVPYLRDWMALSLRVCRLRSLAIPSISARRTGDERTREGPGLRVLRRELAVPIRNSANGAEARQAALRLEQECPHPRSPPSSTNRLRRR